MTPQEWAMCVMALRAAYPHSFKLDASAIEVWFELLGDLPGERVIAAVKHMAKTQKAFPSIADIRKLAEPEQIDPTSAWVLATRYASEWSDGPIYRGGQRIDPPALPDAAIARAVESVGGVQSIRSRRADDEPAMRAHFFKAYEAAASAERRRVEMGEAPALQVLDGGAGRAAEAMKRLADKMGGIE